MPEAWSVVGDPAGAAEELAALLASIERTYGVEPLSEPAPGWLEHGPRRHALRRDDRGALTGYAVLAGDERRLDAEPALGSMDEKMADLLANDGRATSVLLRGPDAGFAAELEAHGFVVARELVRLRRGLPAPAPDEAGLRPRAFRPGHDEQAWVEENNAAFASDAYQSAMTTDRLVAREREPWFDPEGFLLFEDGGRLAASCWTKVHHYPGGDVGEIYVISVAPHAQGRGLGRHAVLWGLAHLSALGLEQAELYVRTDNARAIRLYESLGFSGHWPVVELARPAPGRQPVPTMRPIA